MTNEQLKGKLWDSANAMRAHGGLKASDYAVPVLGLTFSFIFTNFTELKIKNIKTIRYFCNVVAN